MSATSKIANAKTIWRIPAYLPYLQPALTPVIVAQAEKKIGYRIPAEYLSLLEVQNGGYIQYSLPEMVHDLIFGIGPNFPSLTECDWDDCRECVSFELNGLVPFDGDGHWYLCLDYRENAESPSITYVDTECDEESEVAQSFVDYLSRLQLDVNGFVLESVTDIELLKSRLSSLLKITFDAPSSWEQGYPIHRAVLGQQDFPQCIWISPNDVSRGFVREDDHRYAELRNLMPGDAPRYHELPASSYLLDMTDSIRSRVLNACADASFKVRPLREYLN